MEAGMLVLTAIGVVVAGAAAAFAWVQAHAALESLKDAREARDDAAVSARESARLAGEANAAFRRQAEAQEEANRLKREEMKPVDWTVGAIGESVYRVLNTAGETLTVESFTVTPVETAELASVETSHTDGVYEVGDAFTVTIRQVWAAGPEKLTIRYRRGTDPAGEILAYYISL